MAPDGKVTGGVTNEPEISFLKFKDKLCKFFSILLPCLQKQVQRAEYHR